MYVQVRYYHCWVEEGTLYIQLECMDYSLESRVGMGHVLPEPELAHILRDCLKGLVEIHSADMAHMDVKVGGSLACAWEWEGVQPYACRQTTHHDGAWCAPLCRPALCRP